MSSRRRPRLVNKTYTAVPRQEVISVSLVAFHGILRLTRSRNSVCMWTSSK